MEDSGNDTEATEESDKGLEGPFIPRQVEKEVVVALHGRHPLRVRVRSQRGASAEQWELTSGEQAKRLPYQSGTLGTRGRGLQYIGELAVIRSGTRRRRTVNPAHRGFRRTSAPLAMIVAGSKGGIGFGGDAGDEESEATSIGQRGSKKNHVWSCAFSALDSFDRVIEMILF